MRVVNLDGIQEPLADAIDDFVKKLHDLNEQHNKQVNDAIDDFVKKLRSANGQDKMAGGQKRSIGQPGQAERLAISGTFTMRSDDLAAVDTNILVFSSLEEDPRYAKSNALIDNAMSGELKLCITPTVIAEFYAVMTGEGKQKGVTEPLTPEKALITIAAFRAILEVLPFPDDVVDRWSAMVQHNPVLGQGIFDYQIAATMLANGVKRIYTYDPVDFTKIEGIEVLIP